MDQTPGPIIAKLAAKIASARATHGLPEQHEASRATTIPVLAIAASDPAGGVKRPRSRNIAAATPITCKAMIKGGAPSRMPVSPKWISAAPVSKRRSKRPMPGQPSANVENSRCTISHSQSRRLTTESAGLKLGLSYPPFRGLELNDPALYRDRNGMRPVIDMKFCENIRDVALDRLLGNEEFARDLLVRIAGGDQAEHVDLAR